MSCRITSGSSCAAMVNLDPLITAPDAMRRILQPLVERHQLPIDGHPIWRNAQKGVPATNRESLVGDLGQYLDGGFLLQNHDGEARTARRLPKTSTIAVPTLFRARAWLLLRRRQLVSRRTWR